MTKWNVSLKRSFITSFEMTTFSWRVLSPNTLRSYEQAAKDFEIVAGFPIRLADDVSIARWQASMEARGMSVNTIRTRLSALSVITGIRVELPKREHVQHITLSAEQVRAILSVVSDPAHRVLLVKLLTLGAQARTVPPPATTFGAHFAGETSMEEKTAQQMSRMLKSYAAKAGLNERQISLRVWCLTGRKLCEVLDIREFVDLIGHAEKPSPVEWRPLHGIGRRSGSRSMSV